MDRITQQMQKEAQAYAGRHDRPLGSYLVVGGAYGVAVAGMAVFVTASGRRLPEHFRWADLGLLAVATHKISRLLAKDPVTSPLRAPFTRYSGTSGEAELAEEVRGSGLRKAVGELVTCPFCLGQWVATTGIFGLVVAPRLTRAVASSFTVLAGADILQFAYASLEES
jgi:hypothetical protein